jgi:uncharacterized protein YggT (Ycf19 family)
MKNTTIAKQAIDIVLWIFVSLLLIRFALRLVGANVNSSFMQWILATTDPMVAPFKGLFSNFGKGQYTLELDTVIAIVVYSVLATLLIKLVDLLSLSEGKGKK